MSSSLISRSDDLSQLAAAGYHLEIRGAYLVVRHIPYIAPTREIKTAAIVTALNLLGSESDRKTARPQRHTVWWTGEVPHTADGRSLQEHLECNSWSPARDLGEGIFVTQEWSRKPRSESGVRNYLDYREQIETYFREVADHAEAQQPGSIEAAKLHHRSEGPIATRFHYVDTNAYRNGTKGIETRIEDEVVAVVGVGGSGSYLVDVLAKTDIRELHLFDDDVMQTHNAFRVAGAARIGELDGNTSKVAWHERRYREVRKEGLHVHSIQLTDDTLSRLQSCTTVFIAVDHLPVRRKLQRACTSMGILHLAVGIGLEIEGMNNDQLGGNVKVEVNYRASADDCDASARGEQPPDGDDVYRSNIQTAELNMLSAALAITEWKAVRQVYRSERRADVDSIIYSSTTGEILVTRKGA